MVVVVIVVTLLVVVAVVDQGCGACRCTIIYIGKGNIAREMFMYKEIVKKLYLFFSAGGF